MTARWTAATGKAGDLKDIWDARVGQLVTILIEHLNAGKGKERETFDLRFDQVNR